MLKCYGNQEAAIVTQHTAISITMS